MQETKDTGIIVSIIIVIVLVIAIIAYIVLKAPTAVAPTNTQATTASDTTNSATSLPSSTTSNPSSTSMQSTDPIAAGKAFLAENAKKPGVVTLPDGLQYSVIKEGTGPKPTKSQTVTVNYEGKLIDGSIFDSSYQRGEPISFGVTQVIPGWTEILQLMPVGSTWMVYIPSDLAYGASGAGAAIGPNETLIFKIELISAQ
jgi:FKBP-type peptidyl-prolyl cis-trans isomerase